MTLELLFQFCYPDRRPDVDKLEFDALSLLAEAAEKYQVIPAMNICKIIMRYNKISTFYLYIFTSESSPTDLALNSQEAVARARG